MPDAVQRQSFRAGAGVGAGAGAGAATAAAAIGTRTIAPTFLPHTKLLFPKKKKRKRKEKREMKGKERRENFKLTSNGKTESCCGMLNKQCQYLTKVKSCRKFSLPKNDKPTPLYPPLSPIPKVTHAFRFGERKRKGLWSRKLGFGDGLRNRFVNIVSIPES